MQTDITTFATHNILFMGSAQENIISIREFSRRVGVSDTAVRNEIYNSKTNKNGCLKASVGENKNNGRPVINYTVGIAEWTKAGRTIRNPELIPHKGDVDAPNKKIEIPRAPDGFPTAPPPAPSPIVAGSSIDRETNIFEANRLKAVYEAGLKELAYLKMLGSLVPVDRVRTVLFAYGKQIKETLLQIPARVAPSMRSAEDDKAAQDILYKEYEALLVALTDGPSQSMSEDAVDPEDDEEDTTGAV